MHEETKSALLSQGAQKNCAYCGKVFQIEPGVGRSNRKYCSQTCARMANTMNAYKKRPERFSTFSYKGYRATDIITRYGHKCALCGWQVSDRLLFTKRGTQYAYGNEIHHIVPIDDGGESDWDNLILLCPNHHKMANLGVITPEELKKHVLQPWTEEEIFEMKMKSTASERIVAAIMPYIKSNKEN